VRKQHVDLFSFRFQEGFHDLLALGACEIAGLRTDDLVARLRRDDFSKAFLAIVGRSRTDCALQLHDIDVAGNVLGIRQQPAPRLAAFLDEVRADQRQVQGLVGDLDGTVGEDDGNIRGLGFTKYRFPAGFHHWRERDDADTLRDERAQRLDLVFLLLLRIRETQRDAGFGRRTLNGSGVGRAPFAFGADLAETEHDGAAPTIRPGFSAGTGHEQGRSRGGQRHPNEALHRSPLK
jgi:hypothetical protein